MLSKRYRLPGYLIPFVVKEGKTCQNPFFVLKYLPIQEIESLKSSPQSHSLFAFVFSKKLTKKAVVRNWARRRLIEAIRHLLPEIKLNLVMIFLAKKAILAASYQEIEQELKKILKKLN